MWALGARSGPSQGGSGEMYTRISLTHPLGKSAEFYLYEGVLYIASELVLDEFKSVVVETGTVGHVSKASIHVLTVFSPLWFLLAHFLPRLDALGTRMSSYEDLVDTLTDQSEPLATLVESGVDLRETLELCCDVVVEGSDSFFRPSRDRMVAATATRLEALGTSLPKRVSDMLSTRLGPCDASVLALAARQQAMAIMEAFCAPEWLLWATAADDWTPLESAQRAQAVDALALAQKRPLEPSRGVKAKAAKPQPAKPRVGPMDRFFARKA